MPPKKRARTSKAKADDEKPVAAMIASSKTPPPIIALPGPHELITETRTAYERLRFQMDHPDITYIYCDVVIKSDMEAPYTVETSVQMGIPQTDVEKDKIMPIDPEASDDKCREPLVLPGGGKAWPKPWLECVSAYVVQVLRRAIASMNVQEKRGKSEYVCKLYTARGVGVHPDAGSCIVTIGGVTPGVDDVTVPGDLDITTMVGPFYIVTEYDINADAVADGHASLHSIDMSDDRPSVEQAKQLLRAWEDGWTKRLFEVLR